MILSWFGCSISSVVSLFPLFIINMAHLSVLNSIPISKLYILIVSVRVSSFFFFPSSYKYYYQYYYFTSCEFFTPALADGFSLVSGRQQVSSCHQDSSQYSVQSQQCCSLDGLDSTFDFQLFQPLSRLLGTIPRALITIGIIVTLIILLYKSKVKLATLVEGDPKAPFSIATTSMCRGRRDSIAWIAPLYPWSLPYNGECLAKRHQVPFFSLWYDSTCDWTRVSRAISEHSTH